MAGILKVDKYQDFNGNDIMTSDGSGTITMPSGVISGQNYPAFEAYSTSVQSLSDNVATKVVADLETFDTDSCYDTSTYRFTPNVAGKYYFYGRVLGDVGAASNTETSLIYLYKNGSNVGTYQLDFRTNYGGNYNSVSISKTIDMNGTTDYVELFIQINDTSGTPSVYNDSSGNTTVFSAYRIGA